MPLPEIAVLAGFSSASTNSKRFKVMTSNTHVQLPALLVITLKRFEWVNAEEDAAKTVRRLEPDKALHNSLSSEREHPDPHLQDTGFLEM